MLTVKLVRSRFGWSPKQRATLAAMGLRRIRQERTYPDNEAVRGMIAKVRHLVEVTSL